MASGVTQGTAEQKSRRSKESEERRCSAQIHLMLITFLSTDKSTTLMKRNSLSQ